MTDVAQRVAIDTRKDRAFPDGWLGPMDMPISNPGNLQLNSAEGKVPVYVYTFDNSGTATSGYALSADATTFYTGGLTWNPQSGEPYALFVVFVFLNNTAPYVTSISCENLYYSDEYSGSLGDDAITKQLLCIPPASNTYQFTATFSDGSRHDPQIVVTPM